MRLGRTWLEEVKRDVLLTTFIDCAVELAKDEGVPVVFRTLFEDWADLAERLRGAKESG